jgi:hypothetical protein
MLLSGGIGSVIAIQTQCTPAGVCLYTLAPGLAFGRNYIIFSAFQLDRINGVFHLFIDAPTPNYRIELLQVGFLRATCAGRASCRVGLGDTLL